MIVERYVSSTFGVNTWLITEKEHGVLIDPILTSELERKISSIELDYAILTHEHYDHIAGVNALQEKYRVHVLCGEKAVISLNDPTKNFSRFSDFIARVQPFGDGSAESVDYCCQADGILTNGEVLFWRGHKMVIRETPGHSEGSIAILIDDVMLFSGDVIFKNYPTATRLPGGSTIQFKAITEPWLESLPGNIKVYPGHAEPLLMRERYSK